MVKGYVVFGDAIGVVMARLVSGCCVDKSYKLILIKDFYKKNLGSSYRQHRQLIPGLVPPD